MGRDNNTPGERRERLRQEEGKNKNPGGVMKDATHRASHGSLVDLVGGLEWKGTGIRLLVLIVGFIIYAVFFINGRDGGIGVFFPIKWVLIQKGLIPFFVQLIV